jgi:hypothetical protein
MRAPVLGGTFPAVTHTRIDRRLVVGAALFGIGWGLAGYCPAPAIASFGAATPNAALFIAAMIGGMALHNAAIAAATASRSRREVARTQTLRSEDAE